MASAFTQEPVIDPMWIDHPSRGALPQELVYAAQREGRPDDDAAYLNAKSAAYVAYMLGFKVEVAPREVAGQRIPGSYVLHVRQPGG